MIHGLNKLFLVVEVDIIKISKIVNKQMNVWHFKSLLFTFKQNIPLVLFAALEYITFKIFLKFPFLFF